MAGTIPRGNAKTLSRSDVVSSLSRRGPSAGVDDGATDGGAAAGHKCIGHAVVRAVAAPCGLSVTHVVASGGAQLGRGAFVVIWSDRIDPVASQ